MLKRHLFIGFFLAISILNIAQDTTARDFKALENIILNRSHRLERIFDGLDIRLNASFTKIEASYGEMIVREYRTNQITDVSVENIISFFLNLEESLLINKVLNIQNPNEIVRIEVIDALYEYPFIDDSGKHLIYISDKGTGNRNPFILDLVTYKEKQIMIPETGDYFPILIEEMLYFLIAVENGFSIIAYDIKKNEMEEIKNGKITCLRKNLDSIYYSEGTVIYKMDLAGRIVQRFYFKFPIQSFDVEKDHLLISMLDGIQYDLFVYNVHDNSIQRLTNTDYHEVDVVFKDDQTALFSSNRTGHYGLYDKNINEFDQLSQYNLIYEGKNEDIFYPYYSEFYSKFICSVYMAGKEPKLLIIPQ